MKKTCPECGGDKLTRDYVRGELICTNCGLVVEEDIADQGPEWRAFDAEQRDTRARGGAPINYMRPNKGLVTEIDKYNRDIRGARISSGKKEQMYRLRKWHKRASIATSMERNLAIALSELSRMASYLGLAEEIRESAALLYRNCVKKGLVKGRTIEVVVAAVIYIICRKRGVPRTLNEISKIAGIEKKEIGRAYRYIVRELDVDVPLADPTKHIPKFASILRLSGKAQEEALEILKKASKKGLISGRGPTGLAAAAIYIASVMTGERRTQKEVARAAGVTEVTIRNRYRELKKALNLDVDLV
ncbi:MAG: transcription initiation factor IIB [Candidatus Micrarchaeia archaeon]